MNELDYTKEESRYLSNAMIKAKKEIQRQRDLVNLVVGSSWMTIPVYSEVVKIDLDEQTLEINDEWDVTYLSSIEDFLVRNNFHG